MHCHGRHEQLFSRSTNQGIRHTLNILVILTLDKAARMKEMGDADLGAIKMWAGSNGGGVRQQRLRSDSDR